MRILLVSQEYPPETAKGGIGSQTYLKAHGLAALGHHVHVISRANADSPVQQDDHGVQVTRIPGFDHRTSIYTEAADWLTYSAEVAAAVAAVHQANPVDLVEFPEWAAEGYVHLVNQTEWNHIPTAIQLHGPLAMFAHTMNWPDLDSLFYQIGSSMEATCVRLADAVFSSSQCSIDWCAKHYGLNPEGVPVLHTGVDTTHFQPRPVKPDPRPTIAFVGKIAENKGVRLLVQAAAQLAPKIPGLQLRLIGRGPDRLVKDLRKLAAGLGAPNLLDLPGFVSREELPDHLSRAHLFAAPSVYEGGPGFVYLEAMACGLPVIACQGSGAAEALGDRALLVPPGDVNGLTDALRVLLTDHSMRRKLAENGRRHVLDHADSKQCIQRLAAFYADVARHKGRRQMP